MYCPITNEINCKCSGENIGVSALKVDLKAALRKLFTDHAVYTKFFIESNLNNSSDLNAITQRLLLNQSDIGDYIGSILGSENGNKLTELLKDHIMKAAETVSSLKTNNSDKINDAVKKLFENSEQVANFLNSLNPEKLSLNVVSEQFHHHNQYVIDIATLHYKKQYDNEIKKYDAYYNHMLAFSDMLFNALSQQNGGNNIIYEKYIKYKSKYLDSKSHK